MCISKAFKTFQALYWHGYDQSIDAYDVSNGLIKVHLIEIK